MTPPRCYGWVEHLSVRGPLTKFQDNRNARRLSENVKLGYPAFVSIVFGLSKLHTKKAGAGDKPRPDQPALQGGITVALKGLERVTRSKEDPPVQLTGVMWQATN